MGRKCRTPLFRNRLERNNLGEKSYAYKRRRDLTFEVNDFVYPKVSPMRGIRRFNIKGKLAPGYIGPFKVLEKKGVVAYKLELPPGLTGVHDVFHVSHSKKCLRVPEEEAPPEGLDVREDLTYTEHPVKILDTQKELPGTRGSKCASAGHPPTFSHATEELQADDWLHAVERQLDIAQCNDRERVLYGSGQLRGAALDWWESYRPQDRDAFTWAQFRENFRNHHVLAGLMKMKKEFLSL
ncbi:hypothetical protein U9M48_042758 [Paspalum notatum var. saurae]|uniref:Retrotransposon gag domain-containing protein n=1 Tax=Paspalum notatum var. saurae TaxID=547442 RepID=A0AAQ3UVH1_PASNO